MRRTNLYLGLVAVLLTAAPLFAQNEKKSGPNRQRLEEFCRRAATISPLDATAHFTLARWCNESGLGKQARRYLERTIAIDVDHSAARKALGYVRHGTGWVLETVRDKNRSRQGTDDADDADDEETGVDDAVEEPLVIEPENIDSTDPSPLETEEMTDPDAVVDVTELDAALAAKKEWAAAVEERMQQPLKTYEDDDFLVHTTLPSVRHQKMLQLISHLKSSKKLVGQFLGVPSSKTRLWPAKVQFLLTRSEQQYEQFAELIDDVDFAKNSDGGYTSENHTVLHKPTSFLVVRRLAEDALKDLHDSTRQYSWWIVQGTAEEIVSISKTTKGTTDREKQTFARHFRYVARMLKSENDELSIYDLLESRELKRREIDRGRSTSMTLVDYLYRARRKGFQTMLADLKGTDAPVTPDEDDEDGWKTYWLTYFAFQEKSLKAQFRKDTDDLDKLWRRHVIDTAAKYGNLETEASAMRRNRGRNRN